MKVECINCNGNGFILKHNHRDICNICHGDGLMHSESIEDDIIQRMAGYIYKLDIDEDICKKVKKCRLATYETDAEECVDCIVDFFSSKCKWEHDEFCINDESEWVADFAYPSRCGMCDLYEPINAKDR